MIPRLSIINDLTRRLKPTSAKHESSTENHQTWTGEMRKCTQGRTRWTTQNYAPNNSGNRTAIFRRRCRWIHVRVLLVGPGNDVDEIRHKRRYQTLEDGRIAPDHVLFVDIRLVVLLNDCGAKMQGEDEDVLFNLCVPNFCFWEISNLYSAIANWFYNHLF